MTLSREQYSYMTDYIKRQYAYSADWCKKVNNMPDRQIFAIYCRMTRSHKKKEKPIKQEQKPSEIQLTIWDYIRNGELS